MGAFAGSVNAAVIDFEGVLNLSPVGTIGGTTFGIAWIGLVDFDAGGSGDFANEPSASTIAALLNTTELQQSDTRIVFAAPVQQVSFSYSFDNSGGPTASSFYDHNDNLLGTLTLDACGFTFCGAPCVGDPGGVFCAWTPVTFSARNIAYMEVDLASALNSFLLDNLATIPAINAATPIPALGAAPLAAVTLMLLIAGAVAARRYG